MTRRDRLRRAGILCLHTLRNLAFYESWDEAGKPGTNTQFWINANGNFLDIAILEWCKLFADKNGKHHYTRVIDDPAQFMTNLLASLNINEDQFAEYVAELKRYRDKFIAHLDELEGYVVPYMATARESARFLYVRLREQEQVIDAFVGLPNSASAFYDHFRAEGLDCYGKVG